MAFNNEIMVASGGDEQHPGEPTIENIPGGGSQGGVTGVKGNAESTYRDGNVNITQDNIIDDTSTNDISDSDVFITKEGNTWYKKTFSKVWDYIKSKIKSVLHVDTGTIDDIVNVYGSKNLLHFLDKDYYKTYNNTGIWSSNVYSLNGIDFTVNSDGTVKANGTASETANFYLFYNAPDVGLDASINYILSGCPSNGASSKYYMSLWNQSTASGFNDYGDGATFSIASNSNLLTILIRIVSGQTVSNMLFKPMIRCASIQDDTYEPYAKTNKQLTDDTSKSELLNLLHPVGTIIESTTCDTMAKVVAAYGGTTWKQHTGYILRGASSNVTSNDNSNSGNGFGGSDTETLTGAQSGLKKHGHGFTQPTVNGGGVNSGWISADHTHTEYGLTYQFYGCQGNAATADSRGWAGHSGTGTTSGVSANHYHYVPEHTHTVSGGAVSDASASNATSAHSTVQRYKNIYIWERTA